MLISGKDIAIDIQRRLLTQVRTLQPRRLRLGVVVVEHDAMTRQFLTLKQEFGRSINVDVEVLSLRPLQENNEHLLQLILQALRTHDGLILQLPLPERYNLEQALNLLPLSLDVDVIGTTAYQQFEEGTLPFLPPVIGACAEILHRREYTLAGKHVVVVGEGKLVGAPAIVWARRLGATVTVVNRETDDVGARTREADVIILGAGSPGLLQKDMVKDGVVVLDAGTSEAGGVVHGDADPAVAEKAMIFTPTPGGIGPITVAKVFQNLLTLDGLKHKREE